MPSADATSALAPRAFLWACELDVAAAKPGNVSLASPGHRMEAAQFIESARVAAAPLCERGRPVGERIEAAVEATWAAVGCNTNLGIVLLCAPLAAASERCVPGGGVAELRRAIHDVMAGLDVADAAAAYRAIARAQPGGLGKAPEQDVAQAPSIGLREAMALAQHRDRIAWQYPQSMADVLQLGLPAFESALRAARVQGASPRNAGLRAMLRAFLEFVAAFPDSHIVRKHGDAVAHSVIGEARPWLHRARSGEDLAAEPQLAAWDASLKQRGLNPGTSADLSVATAMAAALLEPSLAA